MTAPQHKPMAEVRIERVSLRQVDLPPKVLRTDAIQSFVTQETLMLTLHCSDGIEATGYAYTIGTGGSSVLALLKDHLAPRLIGRDPVAIEAIWKDLFFHTHATAVGAITSLALACVDTALWDWRARSQGLPLWRLLGGAQPRVPLYTTEGGWLHLSPQALVEQTLQAQAEGLLSSLVLRAGVLIAANGTGLITDGSIVGECVLHVSTFATTRVALPTRIKPGNCTNEDFWEHT